MLIDMDDADRWQDEHPNVTVVLAERPPPAADWRAQAGHGWIVKVWFRTWSESREALRAIRAEGWKPKFWGRKLRAAVTDGYDGQRLADFVLASWPDARIQLRKD
jgi:hypothetical protein